MGGSSCASGSSAQMAVRARNTEALPSSKALRRIVAAYLRHICVHCPFSIAVARSSTDMMSAAPMGMPVGV